MINPIRATNEMKMSIKRCPILALIAVLLAPLALRTAAETKPAKPNIVIILVDDMGYGDIGPFGATLQKTPRLDRMAQEGIKFTSFYAAPVCSASRAQLMTGCYAARVSVPGVYSPASPHGLNPAEPTIAKRLKALGYATICIGKWHLGDQPEFLPTKQGFDHYFGLPYSNDMQLTAKATHQRVVPLMRDDKVIEMLAEPEQARLVERYTDEAVKFICENRDRPFFLYLPHTAVHAPHHPGAAFVGKSGNGLYGDWVEEVDASTGRILDTLRELNLDERTLVIVTSDNGPAFYATRTTISGHASAGPLRGWKGSTWEGGMREAMIARWPGKIPAGSTCDAVSGTIDLLPTCVTLAGGAVPSEPVIDGRDISPLLLGKSTISPREAHYYTAFYSHLPFDAVRQGPWKLAIDPQREGMGIEKLSPDAAGNAPRLYNLEIDIGERTDVAAKHPEIVAKLLNLVAKMNDEIKRDCRPAGVSAHPVTLYPTENGVPSRAKDNKVKKEDQASSEAALTHSDGL